MKSYFDGEDWVYQFASFSLVLHEEISNAQNLVSENYKLFFREYLPKRGDVVLDVGAGVGTEVVMLSKLVGAKGRVVAIEADPRVFRRLKKMVTLSKLKNVLLFNFAASDVNGILYLHNESIGGESNFVTTLPGPFSSEVVARRLDSLLAELKIQSIDYLKMNIEGSEISALKGLGTFISHTRRLCIGCHDFLPQPEMKTFNQVSAYLVESSFQVMKHPENKVSPWESWYVYGKNQGEYKTRTSVRLKIRMKGIF